MSEKLFAYEVKSSVNITAVTFVSEREELLPSLAHDTDTGFDCRCAVDCAVIPRQSYVKIPLGFRCLFGDTEFYYFSATLRGRSGLASKGILAHVGTIDNEYTGYVSAVMFNLSSESVQFEFGDRIAQLVIEGVEKRRTFFDYETKEYTHKKIYQMTKESFDRKVAERKRGDNGFGSTGIS